MSSDNTYELDRRTLLKATGATGAALAGGGFASATSDTGPEELLVGVSKPTDAASIAQAHVPERASVVHTNEVLGYATVRFPAGATEARRQFISSAGADPDVQYVEANFRQFAQYSPNDPKFSQQYAPQMVGADTAWDDTFDSSDVTIAVIDGGVQYDHPDLSAQFGSDKGHDFVDSDPDPYPDDPAAQYHGTHVAGIASATTDNGTGVAGISNSTLLSGRVFDETGSGSIADISDAIQWAADQGADVINLSLGGSYSSTQEQAVQYAQNQGSLIVAAAGNGGGSNVIYPAALPECVAVSALNADGTWASYSNVGSEIELTAPGTDVLSTTTDAQGSYEKLSGTSMATPVVAGVAALTIAKWGTSNAETRRHLKATAVDVGLKAKKQGCGRVDAAAAVGTDPATTGTCSTGTSGGGGGGGDGNSQ